MKRHLILAAALILLAAGCGQQKFDIPSKLVRDVMLDNETCSVRIDETYPLSVSFGPAGASSVIEWTSLDESIATVSVVGTVTGISEGQVRIAATSVDNPFATDTCVVTVLPRRVYLNRITISLGSSYELERGKMIELGPYTSLAPSNATDSDVSWSSSDNSVAVVTGTGMVRALKAGNATITVTANDGGGASASVVIVVPGKVDPEPGPDTPGGDDDEDPPADPDLVMFHNCDDLTYFTHTQGATVETTGRMEGKGYIERTTNSDNQVFVISRVSKAMDTQITDYSKGYLVFWFYIDDAASLKRNTIASGRIELSQSGGPNKQCLYWSSKTFLADVISDGWNYIQLKFSDAKEMTPDNKFNPKGANYFRIYFDGPAGSYQYTYGIDAIGFKQTE